MAKVTFGVPGISCEGCASAIRRVLARSEGVVDVEVDVAGKLVHVSYEAGATSEQDLSAALATAGFPPASTG